MNSLERQKKIFIISSLVIPMALLIGFVVVPAFDLIRMSFTNWDGYSKTYDYIGIGNYFDMLKNKDLWQSLRNNAVYFFGHLLFIPVELMFAVLLTSKLRASKFYKTMVFMDEVKNRDKRLQQTIRMGDYKRIDGGVQTPAPPIFSYTYTGYQPIKYCLDDVFYDSGANNDNSIPLIRFAEVLLNYAEAKAELGVFTDADWEKTIGALRGRAGITGGLTARPTKADPYLQANYFPEITDPSLLEIRRERGIELVFEGLRFSDLLRWKKGNLMTMPWNGFYVPELDKPMDLNEDGILDVCFTMNENVENPISGVTYVVVSEMKAGKVNPQRLSGNTKGELTWLNNIPRVWEDKHYLYPIPDLDIIMNPNLTQNPGW